MIKWFWIFIGLMMISSCNQQTDVTMPSEKEFISFEDSLFEYQPGMRYSESIRSIGLDEKHLESFIEEKEHFKKLRYLRLEEEQFLMLPATVLEIPSLERVSLWGTYLSRYYVDSLKEIFPKIEISYFPHYEMVMSLDEVKQSNPETPLHVILDCDWEMSKQFDSLAKYPNILTLDYTMCESMTIPRNIGQFKGLYKLHIGECDLLNSQIPRTLGNCRSIRDLYGNGNLFNDLPFAFYDLDSLESATFWNCFIKRISPRIANWDRMELLFLDYNQIDSLPSEIGKMEKLRLLSIMENPIRSFPKEIKNCKNLRWIYIEEENWDPANLDSLKKWFPESNLNEGKSK